MRLKPPLLRIKAQTDAVVASAISAAVFAGCKGNTEMLEGGLGPLSAAVSMGLVFAAREDALKRLTKLKLSQAMFLATMVSVVEKGDPCLEKFNTKYWFEISK